MANIVVGHRSSIELLDIAQARSGRHPQAEGQRGARAAAGRLPDKLPLPCEVLCSGANDRRSNREFVARLWTGPVPRDAVVPLRGDRALGRAFRHEPPGHARSGDPVEPGGVLVSAPEFALVQMASGMSRARIAELGMQLAGTYRRLRPPAAVPYAGIPRSTMDCFPDGSSPASCLRATAYGIEPLTSVERIRLFLDAHPGLRGSGRVRAALADMTDGVASPLEAWFHLLACMSRRFGGFRLPAPMVNRPLELSPLAAEFAGAAAIVPDMSWADRRGKVAAVVELNGHGYHGGRAGVDKTSRRSKAYAAMGVSCLTVTPEELADQGHFENVMRELSRAAGVRFVAPDARMRARTALLRRELGMPGAPRAASGASPGRDTDDERLHFELLAGDIDRYGRL